MKKQNNVIDILSDVNLNENYFFIVNERSQVKIISQNLLSEMKKPFRVFNPSKHSNFQKSKKEKLLIKIFYDSKCK